MILLFLSVNQAQANVKPVGHDLTRKREAGEGTAIRSKVGDAEALLDLHAIESLHLLDHPDHGQVPRVERSQKPVEKKKIVTGDDLCKSDATGR